jgi:predicted secreted hydrolase
MHEDRYSLRFGKWSVYEDGGIHILSASLNDGSRLDAALCSAKSPILNGDEGAGLSNRGNGATANHFSFTRMAISGRIALDGSSEPFTGTGWMDREYGTWNQIRWDWFSVQLDDGTELMIYHFRDEIGAAENHSYGAFIDTDGNATRIESDGYLLTPMDEWKSPETGTVFPSGWRIEIPLLDMAIDITPYYPEQELDTRGTTMVIYWEGCCKVTGSRSGTKVHGRAYAELVGYDRSHERMDLGTFLFGNGTSWVKRIL